VTCAQDVLLERVNRVYELKETFPSAYSLVGRTSIDWAEYFARKSEEEVRCVFDDGGPDKDGLLRAAGVEPKVTKPIFRPSRDIQDRKRGIRRGVVQIQASDFLAYEVSKYVKDHTLIRAGVRKGRESLKIFGQKKPDMFFFNERRVIGFCKHFKINPRPMK